MSDRIIEAKRLRTLLNDSEAFADLAAYLVANSRLPGPRANLRLAELFADQVGSAGADNARWQLLRDWISICAADAPTGEPREFLPFCALQALEALYAGSDAARREEIVALLRVAADDERWRVRESVAIALQRIAEQNIEDAKAIITAWLPTATLTGQRAIIAALAHSPILRDAGTARYALDVGGQILANVRGLDRVARRTEGFRILRQALEYAISVLVAALPGEGFACMRAWAGEDDVDIKRIVRANLSKGRLKKHSDDVRWVLAEL